MNSYLPYEIGVMVILGILDAIQRITNIVGDLSNHYTGASSLISHATAHYEALSDAFFIFYILIPALYATLICIVLSLATKWRTTGSRVPATRCRVP